VWSRHDYDWKWNDYNATKSDAYTIAQSFAFADAKAETSRRSSGNAHPNTYSKPNAYTKSVSNPETDTRTWSSTAVLL
jgi:hypothetical protein